MIVRGEGPYVWDSTGKRYLDGLAGLFTSQLGHGRMELAEAAGKQAERARVLPDLDLRAPEGDRARRQARRIAPGDLNRVFFTSGGSEAVESAWKLARQYFKEIGQPLRTKVVSRDIAYHGTTMGALSINGRHRHPRGLRAARPGRDQGPEHQFLPGSLLPRRPRGFRALGRGRDRPRDRA